MRILIWALAALTLGVWQASAQSFDDLENHILSAPQTRTALLIGNGDYKYLPNLRNPTNDAQQLALTLSSLGFQVYLATNLTATEQRAALKRYNNATRGADLSLVYFAGHSMPVYGKDITYAVDARPDVRPLAAGFELDEIMHDLAQPSRIDIFLIDACRNVTPSAEEPYPLQLSRELPDNSMLMFASSWGQIAHDGRAQHSIFTGTLLDQIITPNKTLSRVMEGVKRAVIKNADGLQHPHIQSNLQTDPILRRVNAFTDYSGRTYHPHLHVSPQEQTTGLAHKPVLLDLANPIMVGPYLNKPVNF